VKRNTKRVLLSMAALAGLGVVAFVGMVVYDMMPPFRSFARAGEKLPSISVENGDTLYCRMRYCDFRFPLPDKTHIVRTNPITGGADTINGDIYVIDPDGRVAPEEGFRCGAMRRLGLFRSNKQPGGCAICERYQCDTLPVI
jgi:hypothetical protein